MFRIGKPIETESKWVVARGWGEGDKGSDAELRVSFWGDKTFWNLIVVAVSPCEYTKNHWTVYFKRV